MSNKHWSIVALVVVAIIIVWIFISPRSAVSPSEEDILEDSETGFFDTGDGDVLYADADVNTLNDGSVLGEVSMALSQAGKNGNMTLLLPVFGDSSCSSVLMKPVVVPYTTTPLNQIYKEMFSYVSESVSFDDLAYVHPVGSLSGALMFKEASINNRVARVDLIGSIPEERGVCSDESLYAQIKAAGSQFNTIDRTDIYLNGVLVN